MFQRFFVIILALSLVCTISPERAFAADKEKAAEVSTPGPRRYLANIVFAGLAGAILGLSTLSFYGRPQDKLSNIAVGFAIGVIGGTVYTTFKAATEPKDFYAQKKLQPELWAYDQQIRERSLSQAHGAAWTFEF